jgi:SAM-dependent methyltransferase
MTEQEARYDRIAEGYATWWAPVHRAATLRLLDEIEADVRTGTRRLVDIGCGTGALVAAAATRWPDVLVDAVDASAGMLGVAARTLDPLPDSVRRRIVLRHAYADRLGLDDGSADVVIAAFVLQLVPSRYRALREARRALRPGGRLAYVTWLRSEMAFAADVAFDEALVAVGLPRRWSPGGHDELASAAAAVAQLRRAGFAGARARAETLTHQFSPETYLEFLTRFDEEDLFESLAPATRDRVRDEAMARLQALPASGLKLELPIVYATAIRPPAGR